MDIEIIRSKIIEIPVSELGKVASDAEIWEGNDGHAHYKVTRHQLPVGGDIEFLSLSVSGLVSERQRLISEFTQVLGTPADQSIYPAIGHIDFVSWLID